MDSMYWGQNNLDIYESTAYVGVSKRLLLWIECTEDKHNLDIN